MRLISTLALMALLLSTPAFAQKPGYVGSVAPDFTLDDLDGVAHTLSQYRGKVVFLFVVGFG